MAKLNVWDSAFARPALREKTLNFTDPEWSITLRELDEVELCACRARMDEYNDLYVKGKDGAAPLVLTTPDAKSVKASWSLFANIAAVECMQVAEKEMDRYGLLDLVGIAVKFPQQWRRIKRVVSDFWPKEDELGNAEEGQPTT